jgi:hypothetical protein
MNIHRISRWFVTLNIMITCAGHLSAQTAVSVGNTPGYPGLTVSLPVSLKNITNVVAAQFDVAYNPAKIGAGTVLPGAAASNHIVKAREISPGLYRIITYSLLNAKIPITNRGDVAKIPFAVSLNERNTSGPVTPGSILLARRDGTAVSPVTSSPGSIFMTPVNRGQNGEVQFFMPATPDNRFVIQATTNFVDWVNISTNVATDYFMDLSDPNAAHYPFRFYRSELIP